MLNLPNLLTISRILLVPLLVVVLLTKPKFEYQAFVGLGLFLLASLTDFLDGYLARRRRQITKLGQLLDPAADKILVAAALISLVELHGDSGRPLAPAWMVLLMISREFAVSALRSFAAAEGQIIPANWSGKVKTVTQIVAIALLIIYDELGEFRHLAPIMLWVATVVTVLSGVEYFARFAHLVYGGNGSPGGAGAAGRAPKDR
jgi:CDP-diacylglycerol--glycerol-3-phosphate 3-phosphatidyltransferase